MINMQLNRSVVLSSLASLTVLFLLGAAAYAYLGEIPRVDAGVVSGLKAATYPKGDIPGALRLTVHETGIAAVTVKELRAANLRFDTLSAANIDLSRNGEPVPFLVNGEGDETALYFFAQAVTNTLEAPAVYLLRLGTGTAMPQVKAFPTGKGTSTAWLVYHWEENTSFLTQATNDDLWLGPLMLAPRKWQLALDEVHPVTASKGSLSIHLWSSTRDIPDPDHHVIVAINGRSLTDRYWDGITAKTIQLDIPSGILKSEGDNTLMLNAPGDTGATGDALYLDWVQLTYEGELTTRYGQVHIRSSARNLEVENADHNLLVFDITDANHPVYLHDYELTDQKAVFAGTGNERSYVLLEPQQALTPDISMMPARENLLRQPDNGADYIAIVADVDGFIDALQPLLALRQEQGLRVMAVSLTQIYDEFGYGQQNPAAIRAFLTYAASTWQPPAPRYVLLVGDASYDLMNTHNNPNKNLLPTAYVKLHYNGYIASDTWFTLSQENQPQMAVGRFPVQDTTQLTAMVQKTIAYETAVPNAQTWAKNVLLVADDEDTFDMISDELATTLTDVGYMVHDLHMSDNENIHYEIMSAINQGVGLVSYVGAGGARMWGDEAVFHADDAQMLTNADRLPIFVTFTCLNGAFADPQVDSLAESLLWEKDGGVVAAVAPSGRTPLITDPDTTLAYTFYQVYTNDTANTIGDVLLLAKTSQSTTSDDETYLFNLLGDPALRFYQP